MRKVLPLSIFSAFLFASTLSTAQDRFAYAITDLSKDGAGWNSLRRLDLKSGEYSDILLHGNDLRITAYDAVTKKALDQQPDAKYGNAMHAPFATGVAAAAYDRKNNRLYYTPMFIDQLRYVDLKTMQVYYVTADAFTRSGNFHNDEGKCVTRMVIAPDGYGYAISNDGKTLLRFTTGKKIEVTPLGGIVDDPSNEAVSIHSRCTSYGGDIIADDKGNLFIISAMKHVFQVSVETKVAKFLGAIKGLPATYTVNGAVVDGDGNLLVSSAVNSTGYYLVNPKTWEASLYEKAPDVFRSSDLANGNYLSSGASKTPTIETIARPELVYSKNIQVFPNPVVNNQFTMQFNKVPVGDYTIELTDVMGRVVLQKRVTLKSEFQTQAVQLQSLSASGIYLVKLTDLGKKAVFEQKILIQ